MDISSEISLNLSCVMDEKSSSFICDDDVLFDKATATVKEKRLSEDDLSTKKLQGDIFT